MTDSDDFSRTWCGGRRRVRGGRRWCCLRRRARGGRRRAAWSSSPASRSMCRSARFGGRAGRSAARGRRSGGSARSAVKSSWSCARPPLAGVEWLVLELVLTTEPPPVSATATAPPSSTAAITATVIQNPPRALRRWGRGWSSLAAARSGGRFGVAGRWLGGERWSAASIGTVAGRRDHRRHRDRRERVAAPAGSRAAWARPVAHLGGGLRAVLRGLGQHLHDERVQRRRDAGLRSRAGFGATRTCWCRTAADTSATNGGSPVSISYSTHPSE